MRRIYRAIKLNLRRQPKKRLLIRAPQPLRQPLMLNQSWSADFMRDSLVSAPNRHPVFRSFEVIDHYNREALWIEVDTSLPAARVIRVLETIAVEQAYPQAIRTDNGPEVIAAKRATWATQHHMQLCFIQPGKRAQNAYIERSAARWARTYYEEVSDTYCFTNHDDVRAITATWLAKL